MSTNPRLVRLLAAVSAIAAIALAAATIENPLETGGTGSGVGPGEGGGVGRQPGPGRPIAGDPPAFLEYLVYALVILVAVGLVWYLLAHHRDAVKTIAAVLAVLLVGALLFTVLFQGFSPAGPQPVEQPAANGTGGGGDLGSGEGESDSFSTGPLLFVLAVVTAIFVGGLFASRRGGGSGTGAPPVVREDEADDPASDAAAVGSAAGRAADRIDDAGSDVDNEIYRAWREMTDRLEVDRPDSSTPREFAAAAVEAGIDREHVDELTGLFEAVRYGDVETTPEMEARAVDVLRRIEDEYATGDERNERLDGGPVGTEGPRRGHGGDDR
ncbi:DUF4129 domain-containing protein [Halopiger thermotolerans]